jgi:hypothetical protein
MRLILSFSPSADRGFEREAQMTEYQCHWWPSGAQPKLTQGVSLEAQSRRHGAALALRHFIDAGCDISAPAAHIDMTDSDGTKHLVLVDEVVDWLEEPGQAAFVQQEHLATFLREEHGSRR